jgi:hypothetical protein
MSADHDEYTIMNLRMFVWRLVRQITRIEPDNRVAKQASDWMIRKGMGINPLRDDDGSADYTRAPENQPENIR